MYLGGNLTNGCEESHSSGGNVSVDVLDHGAVGVAFYHR